MDTSGPHDTNPVPGSSLIAGLKARKDELDLRTSISESIAKLAALKIEGVDAAKPAITVADGQSAEGLVLAYLTANETARQIAEKVAKNGNGPVLIQNPADFKALEAMGAFASQLKLLESEFTDAKREATARLAPTTGRGKGFVGTLTVGIAAVGTAISSVLQIVSLFRVNHSLKYSTLTIDPKAFTMAVCGALKAHRIVVHDTASMPLLPSLKDQDGRFQTSMKALLDLRGELSTLLGQVIDRVAAENKDGEKPPEPEADEDSLAGLKKRLETCLADYDALDASLSKMDDATGVSTRAQILSADRVYHLIADNTRFLWAQAVTASTGSDTKTQVGHGDISFSATVIVSWALYSRSGALLHAETTPHYSGWAKRDAFPAAAPAALDALKAMQPAKKVEIIIGDELGNPKGTSVP